MSDFRAAPEGTTACPECRASVPEDEEECPACGARPRREREGSLLSQYSPAVWVLSLLVGFLTYRVAREVMFFVSPLGLALMAFAPVVPGYFLVKAAGERAVEQSRTEVVAVLLLNVVGVAAVEWKGEGGARFALGFFAAITVMGLMFLGVLLLGALA